MACRMFVEVVVARPNGTRLLSPYDMDRRDFVLEAGGALLAGAVVPAPAARMEREGCTD